MRSKKDIFLDDDIFPIGSFETIPVECILDGEADSYPNVVRLKSIREFSALSSEAIENIQKIGKRYVKDRVQRLTPDLEVNTVRQVLTDVGFTKETYQSYSLRKLGSADLEDFITGETRKFFENLGPIYFRMQYAVAAPGWKTTFHIDHRNFNTHGLRAMIPLSAPTFLSYFENKHEVIYELKPGEMYFVNIAKLHKGFNPTNEDRINLYFQMNTDKLVLQGETVKPMSDEQAHARFSTFLSEEIMEIWK